MFTLSLQGRVQVTRCRGSALGLAPGPGLARKAGNGRTPQLGAVGRGLQQGAPPAAGRAAADAGAGGQNCQQL